MAGSGDEPHGVEQFAPRARRRRAGAALVEPAARVEFQMPVEAEDSGTVTEIRCEEGQAVNEGDTLVVLE